LECRIPHLHREAEIVLYDGGKTTAYVDSVRYDLQAGDALVIFPGQIHHYETLEKESFRFLGVDLAAVPALASVFDSSVPTVSVIRGASNDQRICVLAEALTELCAPSCSNPYRDSLILGYLQALLAELLSRLNLRPASRSDSDALRSIVAFCSENYSKDLSLAVLEENLGLSRYYISHLFSDKLGLRFNDYINSLRIFRACTRLSCTDESMTEISDQVGFNTLRTFNRAFMKQMNLSPSDYRRLHRNPKETLE
jgi:AraC-like DNA-binding protein